MRVEPAQNFEVDFSAVKPALAESDQQMLDMAVFGFLDVVMNEEPYPVKNIKLVVLDLNIDPVSSTMMAFRHAGRCAGSELLTAIRKRGIVT